MQEYKIQRTVREITDILKKPNISKANSQKQKKEWYDGTDAIFEEIMAENNKNDEKIKLQRK